MRSRDFLDDAVGTQDHLMLCRDLGHLDLDTLQPHLAETSELARMLYAFRRRVEGA